MVCGLTSGTCRARVHQGLFLGYNHSGKLGQVNFLHGIMGYANAQRALDYIRIITEFISQVSLPTYITLIILP
jgi:glucan 1,3-beta-glucosidase